MTNILRLFIITLFLAVFFVPQGISAAGVETDISGQMQTGGLQKVFNPQLGTYFTRILDVALVIAAVATLFMIISGGISWITSGGDKNKYEEASKRITAGIVGLILVAAGWAIWLLVIRFLGVDKIKQLNIGGSAGSSSSSISGNCPPFPSCAAWEAAYKASHNTAPTAQDQKDQTASWNFAQQCGRNPSQTDWNTYSSTGKFPACNK